MSDNRTIKEKEKDLTLSVLEKTCQILLTKLKKFEKEAVYRKDYESVIDFQETQRFVKDEIVARCLNG